MIALQVLTLLLVIVSFSCYACMWKMQFHYDRSIFADLEDQLFWNPKVSWKNKWKRDPAYPKGANIVLVGEERFPFSSTFLVFWTDGFHRLQFLAHTALILAIALNAEMSDSGHYIVDTVLNFALLRAAAGLAWTVLYDGMLKR
jgi:ABC-type sugar transport system permease subunit